MDPVTNPFTPGAGTPPPELAGRADILKVAENDIKRAKIGNPTFPQLLLGLRGVGKTVLLNRINEIAEENGHLVSFIEAQEKKDLMCVLVPRIHHVLQRLTTTAKLEKALSSIRSFCSIFQITLFGVIDIGIERGNADSGDLEQDLTELFVNVGQALKEAKRAMTLLIDEVQCIERKDFSALIMALHRCSQLNLPILFFGAGLPTMTALSGNAKTYAERLFRFPKVDVLKKRDAEDAIRLPLERNEVAIEDNALDELIRQTHGYPYFLQLWGDSVWNVSTGPVISIDDVNRATNDVIRKLDEEFFRVRYDRLTPKECDYIHAMASFGKGPYKSSDVAAKLSTTTNALAPRRSKLISKGIIFAGKDHGYIDFTVPLFDEFLWRNFPEKYPTEQA